MNRLWDVMDEIVQLNDCDIYTYNPDVDDDPMNEEEGYLWSMNYFFFNRKLKRMIFFSIKSESMNAPTAEDDMDDMDDNDDDINLIGHSSRRYQDEFSMDDMD
ncbi:Maf1 regulator-domain-containing protein [Pilaira anomala]|nr:Maf1 regulator-domain-containing protein [Pilaira anomala]